MPIETMNYSSRRANKLFCTCVLLAIGLGSAVRANAQPRTLIVRDTLGLPIPFATVVVKGGEARVTNPEGSIQLLAVRDTVDLSVRRMGFGEFFGKVAYNLANSRYEVVLLPAVQTLRAVSVVDKVHDVPLARRGFYERMLDAQKGRYNGEYYTPEMLEARNAGKVSQLLNNSKHTRVDFNAGLAILRGRRNCPMSIFIDGQYMRGVYDGPPPRGERPPSVPGLRGDKLTIDDLISPGDIAAIEIYPHSGNAPSAFQMSPDKGGCGVVAIWTGGR
jgi:hypothetical protein